MIDCEGIFWEIVFRWMSLDITDDKSALVQVMAWCRQAKSHYLSQCWPRSMSSYSVTRPQWVNMYEPGSEAMAFSLLLSMGYRRATRSRWNRRSRSRDVDDSEASPGSSRCFTASLARSCSFCVVWLETFLEGQAINISNKSDVECQNTPGCLDQYICRGLRLWSSRDLKAV